MIEGETRVTSPNYTAIEWFTCAICGARQDVEWKHDSPHGPLCPNCWLFFMGDSGCVARHNHKGRWLNSV